MLPVELSAIVVDGDEPVVAVGLVEPLVVGLSGVDVESDDVGGSSPVCIAVVSLVWADVLDELVSGASFCLKKHPTSCGTKMRLENNANCWRKVCSFGTAKSLLSMSDDRGRDLSIAFDGFCEEKLSVGVMRRAH